MGRKIDVTRNIMKYIAANTVTQDITNKVKDSAKKVVAHEMEKQVKSLRGNDQSLQPDFDKYAHELEKLNSFQRNFYMSLVRGVGTAIGATLIAGFVLTILFNTLDTVSDVHILNDFMTWHNEK